MNLNKQARQMHLTGTDTKIYEDLMHRNFFFSFYWSKNETQSLSIFIIYIRLTKISME
jgi:hypothetical protein